MNTREKLCKLIEEKVGYEVASEIEQYGLLDALVDFVDEAEELAYERGQDQGMYVASGGI